MWKPVEDPKLKDRKWELKISGQVIATIYRKAAGQFSLYVSTPIVFETEAKVLGRTYRYKTFDEAKEACDKFLRNKIIPWCSAVMAYSNKMMEQDVDELIKDKKLWK